MKDPAFLFYSNDFLTGTMFFTDIQVGKYIRLLCVQHQTGHLTKKRVLSICGEFDKDIMEKFKKDKQGLYYNVRLDIEKEKRNKFTDSRRKNLSNSKINKTDTHMGVHMKKHMAKHMENEDENENSSKIKDIKKNTVLWNKFAEEENLPQITYMGGTRKTNLEERLKDKNFDLEKLIEKIKESDFLMGKSESSFIINFDWVIKNEENFNQILEGKYKNANGVKKRTSGILRTTTQKNPRQIDC